MRKMILLAAMTAIAALMLAATPALAAPQGKTTICHVPPGNPGNAHTITISDNAVDRHLANHPGDRIGPCKDDGNNNNGDGNGRDDDNDRDFRDFCRFFDCRDNDNDVFPVVDLTQDFEQEAESGDIDQDFDVSQTGDNSNQTVGIQGVANTGNAQNQIGVVDAGGFGAFDDNDFFHNGDDFCEDFNGNDFCEDLEDFCEDFNRDNICDFFFDDDDHNRFFFDDDDHNRFFFGDNDGGDLEFDEVGSNITVSPTNTTSSDQQVNQAATAAG
jgi:hypothetical protein